MQQLAGLDRVMSRELLDQAELDLEGHQLLLRSVVDVAFQLAPFLVLSGDESAPGVPELLDQPDVAEHETRLGRQVADELLLRWVHGVVGRHRDRERPEHLPLMRHVDGVIGERGRSPGAGRPDRFGAQDAADP